MLSLAQSPTDPAFVRNPYPFYERLRAGGDLAFWEDYGMVCAVSHRAVQALLRDRRFGREAPPGPARVVPPHLEPFYAVEAHSMLELEPPRHTRLRGLVLRAFTTRTIAALAPGIADLVHALLDAAPEGPFDLIPALCQPLPVRVIARLLGVPEDMAPQLLAWSGAMVAMYQARRDRQIEEAAAGAAQAFSDMLREHIAARRRAPRDDLLSELIAAEETGDRLSTDEMIATCILLLNAGHEATVHSLGNGVKALLERGMTVTAETAARSVEEVLRFDPPLHMFTRWCYEDCEMFGHRFARGEQVALLLGAANRDPALCADPGRFDPEREPSRHTSFGGGLHFCVGAPLARLEMQIALPILFARLPHLSLAEPPHYADLYHFRGLERLMVDPGR